MNEINRFFAELDQSFFAFTLGVLVFQTIYVLIQLTLTKRLEFLWYVLYLVFALVICLIINTEEGYYASLKESSWGMIFSLTSFWCYWQFWKTLFNINVGDGRLYQLINAVTLIYIVVVMICGLSMIIPSLDAIYQVVFQILSVLIQMLSLILFYFTYKTRDKILSGLMIAGALSANFLMMFPQLIFANIISGIPTKGGMSFLLLSYDVETIFLSIALAYHTRQVFQMNKSLNVRIAEIKMAALRAQMSPHFIYNTLNAINRFLLNNENEAASHYFTKFARLIRLILHHSRMDYILLKEEIQALNLYLEMESLRFRDQFKYEVFVAPDIDPNTQAIPPLLLQPIVENAIHHGLLPKKGERNLDITIELKKQYLQIKITDNGIGRTQAKALRSVEVVKHKSFGINIVKERLGALTESLGEPARFEIIDLLDEHQQALGTQVILEVPAQSPFMDKNQPLVK